MSKIGGLRHPNCRRAKLSALMGVGRVGVSWSLTSMQCMYSYTCIVFLCLYCTETNTMYNTRRMTLETCINVSDFQIFQLQLNSLFVNIIQRKYWKQCCRSGSVGSVIICTDPDPNPSIKKQKDVIKPFISTIFLLLFCFLSLKTDVNLPSKSTTNKQKLFFVGILSAIDEKSRIRIRIRIRKSVVHICGSRTVPKCHGSTTLTGRGPRFFVVVFLGSSSNQ
jgi:hypothetical protein